MRYCANCGEPLPEGALNCPQCGESTARENAAPEKETDLQNETENSSLETAEARPEK